MRAEQLRARQHDFERRTRIDEKWCLDQGSLGTFFSFPLNSLDA